MSSPWLEALGWVGSGILVTSLLQSRLLRLRQLNLGASVLLAVYNGLVGVWPMLAMNVVIAGINVWHLVGLLRTRHDLETYTVVPVDADDRYLRHVLAHHATDIRRFNPDLDLAAPDEPARAGSLAFLVLRETETVGVVLARDAGAGRAQVDLDYVVPRFRDFTPGEFVYRTSGLFTDRGFTSVAAPRTMLESGRYLREIGFVHDGDDRILHLTPDATTAA